MASVVDIRVRNSKKKEGDLDSKIHIIVFPEEQDIVFDEVQEQMMMDGYANAHTVCTLSQCSCRHVFEPAPVDISFLKIVAE
jgi:hypothetical protein